MSSDEKCLEVAWSRVWAKADFTFNNTTSVRVRSNLAQEWHYIEELSECTSVQIATFLR